ncbi:quinolinate synthase, chloroplastic [Panicum virgatum]|uniref:quinolinate synthase, chloroplastic n=1 Tax=Panicum virgatum TaxID=38727 RepID=UPI0019D5DFC0|nr:quinolinate synthase, chloroplastic [Panicum virgatum]
MGPYGPKLGISLPLTCKSAFLIEIPRDETHHPLPPSGSSRTPPLPHSHLFLSPSAFPLPSPPLPSPPNPIPLTPPLPLSDPLHVPRGIITPRGPLAVRCAHSRAPPPPPPPPLPRTDGSEAASGAHPRLLLHRIAEEFLALPSDADRARRLLSLASALPRLPEPDRAPGNRVMGCVARVWLAARCDGGGRMRFAADSDSELSRGYSAFLVAALDGATPGEVLAVDPADPGPDPGLLLDVLDRC